MTSSPAAAGAFGRHVFTLATGTIVAQLLPFAVSPILTRLFTPRDFSTLAVFLGLAGPLSVVATGRYELAIVLPSRDDDARDLRRLVLLIGVAFSVVVLATVAALRVMSLQVAQNRWVMALPLATLASTIYQAYAYWSNRKKEYRRLAVANVVQQLFVASLCVLGGIITHGSTGALVVGTVAGQLLAAAFLFARSHDVGEPARLASLRRVASTHWRFPAFNLPYSFVGTLSSGALPVLIAAMGYVPTAGLFSQARRILYAPANLLSVAIGQVYFEEAARTIGQPSLEELTVKILRGLAWLATPLYVFGSWWAPEAFAVLFGAPWRDAGTIARWFGPVAFCSLFTSWPERIYEVTSNQRLSFILQLVADTVSLATFAALLALGVPPLKAIAVYSVLYCGYHCAYLYVLVRIAKFRASRLLVIVRDIVVIGGVTQLMLVLVDALAVPTVLKFLLGVTSVLTFVIVTSHRWRPVAALKASPHRESGDEL